MKYNNDFERQFPNETQTIEYLQKLKELDLRSITAEELENKIDSYFPLIPSVYATIKKGTVLFRARLNQNNVPFNKISEINLPPKEIVTKYGRANKPFDPVFYGASNFQLAALEVCQSLLKMAGSKGESGSVTVGAWRLVGPDLRVVNLIHSKKAQNMREDLTKLDMVIQDSLQKGSMRNEAARVSELILGFFAEEFAKEKIESDTDYKISSFYATNIRKISRRFGWRVSGIVYPSVAMKFKGDNIAIFAEDFNSNFILATAYVAAYWNFDLSDGIVTATIYETDHLDGDNIVWKKRSDSGPFVHLTK